MGNLLRTLQKDDSCNYKCVNNPSFPEVFIDFVNARPNPEDAEEVSVYNTCESILVKSMTILQKIKDYEGQKHFQLILECFVFIEFLSFSDASQEIKAAIQSPSSETEQKAWDAVVIRAEILKEFFQFALTIAEILPKILNILSSEKASHW